MNRHIPSISIVVFLAALMLLSGCSQQAQVEKPQTSSQQPASQPSSASASNPVPTQPKQESTTIKMDNIYNYGKINEFEYKITSSAGGQQNDMDLKYKISSDTLNGKAAWLQQSDTSVQGNLITSKMWLDKSTLGCLKITTSMSISGQSIQQEGQCPTDGPNSASGDVPVLNYVGTESVTVPAGTFNAKKYEINGAYYWISDSVPLPLKVTYSGEGSVAMELVSFK